jgi:anaerobic selenocysteine-containing dehydrogenase
MGLRFGGQMVPDIGFKVAGLLRRLVGKKGEFNKQEALLRMLARLGGTTYKELEAKPHGFSLDNGKSKDPMAEIRLPGKKARINVPEFLKSVDRLILRPPVKDKDYPLILSTTCRDLGNVNTIYRNEKWIEKHMPENSLIMHPEDAYAMDVSEESRVRINSRTGTGEAALNLSEDVMPGTVYLKGGWGIYSRDPEDDSGRLRGTAAAMFVPDDEAEEFTGMPFLSGIPVRVEKIQ